MDSVEKIQVKLGHLEIELHTKEEVIEKEEKEKKEREEKERLEREEKERKEREEKMKEEMKKKEEQRRRQQEEYQKKLMEQHRRVDNERLQQLEKLRQLKAGEKAHESMDTEPEKEISVADESEITYVASKFSNRNSIFRDQYWRKMKLEVDFEPTEKTDGFLLVGNVPGMKEDDIKIQVTPDSKLVVKGFRGPTAQDLAMMNRILDSKFTFKTAEERLIVCRDSFFGQIISFFGFLSLFVAIHKNNKQQCRRQQLQ